MLTIRRTLQDLTVIDNEVFCQDGSPFDRVAYSRFKYGYLPPAVAYGRGLAALIADELWEVSAGQPTCIISAPYKYVPTASHYIALSLREQLARLAVAKGLEPPVLVPFHKAKVGDSSYARSSEADRLKTVAALGLHLDESRVPGAHWLVVDDIRITGSAELATARYLEPLGPESVWYLHAARLPEDIGKVHPGLEDELNQTVSHNLEDILKDVHEGAFQLNTRVLRRILETQSAEQFRWFARCLPTSLLEQIHDAGVGSGLDYYRKYELNLKAVQIELNDRTTSMLVLAGIQ